MRVYLCVLDALTSPTLHGCPVCHSVCVCVRARSCTAVAAAVGFCCTNAAAARRGLRRCIDGDVEAAHACASPVRVPCAWPSRACHIDVAEEAAGKLALR